MLFRNLTLYRLNESPVPTTTLEARLTEDTFRPCLSQELRGSGWVPPLGPDAAAMVHEVMGCQLVCLQTEDKILPPIVIREALQERVEEMETREQRTVRRQEKDRLKDEIMLDLLPRAFSRHRLDRAYFEPAAGVPAAGAAVGSGWLVADGAGKAVNDLTTRLRKTLGRLPITPLAVAESPAVVMTRWVGEGQLPAGLSLADECELRDAESVVRCKGQDLLSEEIRTHLEAGKQITRLGLVWEDRLSFLLGEDLTLRRLRFLELIRDQLDQLDTETREARLDAEFAVMAGEIRTLLERLPNWFGGLAQPAS